MNKSKEYFKLKNLKYFRNFFDTKEKSDTKISLGEQKRF